MIAIIAKYDIDHFLKMALHCMDKRQLLRLSAVKISFADKTFMIEDLDFFTLKRDEFLGFKIRKQTDDCFSSCTDDVGKVFTRKRYIDQIALVTFHAISFLEHNKRRGQPFTH